MKARNWALLISLLALIAVIVVLLSIALSRTQGHLVYALDDAYIHMAIAKNLSQHGVWGVTRYAFSSSSSSILWTLSLAVVYALFGVNEVAPLILNVIAAVLIAALVNRVLSREGRNATYVVVAWLAVMFLTPVAPLVLAGMEHVAQILIDIAFVYVAARALAGDGFQSRRAPVALLAALSALAALIRFEGMFLVLAVCALFVARRRLGQAVLAGLAGFLPVVLYGVYSISNGQYFLPNPVLMKRATYALTPSQDVIDLILIALERLAEAPHVLILLLAALSILYVEFSRRGTLWETSSLMLIVFAAAAFPHLLLAQTGWFYRYEAYLIALGTLGVALALGRRVPGRTPLKASRNTAVKAGIAAAAVIVGASPIVPRAYLSHREAPQGTRNIYEQQVQMSRFLKAYYEGEVVAANDIGAINFYADIRCLDLWGLSTLDVTRARLEGRFNTDVLSALAQANGAKIAVAYEVWYAEFGGLPKQWNLIGQWTIDKNVVAGSPVVSFYAIDPAEAGNLYEHLVAFAAELPPTVRHWERQP